MEIATEDFTALSERAIAKTYRSLGFSKAKKLIEISKDMQEFPLGAYVQPSGVGSCGCVVGEFMLRNDLIASNQPHTNRHLSMLANSLDMAATGEVVDALVMKHMELDPCEDDVTNEILDIV